MKKKQVRYQIISIKRQKRVALPTQNLLTETITGKLVSAITNCEHITSHYIQKSFTEGIILKILYENNRKLHLCAASALLTINPGYATTSWKENL